MTSLVVTPRPSLTHALPLGCAAGLRLPRAHPKARVVPSHGHRPVRRLAVHHLLGCRPTLLYRCAWFQAAGAKSTSPTPIRSHLFSCQPLLCLPPGHPAARPVTPGEGQEGKAEDWGSDGKGRCRGDASTGGGVQERGAEENEPGSRVRSGAPPSPSSSPLLARCLAPWLALLPAQVHSAKPSTSVSVCEVAENNGLKDTRTTASASKEPCAGRPNETHEEVQWIKTGSVWMTVKVRARAFQLQLAKQGYVRRPSAELRLQTALRALIVRRREAIAAARQRKEKAAQPRVANDELIGNPFGCLEHEQPCSESEEEVAKARAHATPARTGAPYTRAHSCCVVPRTRPRLNPPRSWPWARWTGSSSSPIVPRPPTSRCVPTPPSRTRGSSAPSPPG